MHLEELQDENCDECGEAFPCLHDNPPIAEVEREDHGGWAHGWWENGDA